MTLVELLVVLAILALLTTVAVTSSDVLLSQGRHEATTRTLRAIEEAVLGPQDASSTSDEPAAGFLADIGRLPRLVADPENLGIGLAELWTIPGPPPTMAPYTISRQSDTEVAVGYGWRGPYLRLPAGRDNLRDGWGRPFLLATAGDEHEIVAVRSGGADGESGTNDDLFISLDGTRKITLIHGNVYDISSGERQNPSGDVRVVLYEPAGPVPATVVTNNTVVEYSASGTVGPRYLRAYLGDPASAIQKSNIMRIQHGGVVHLEIR